MSRNTSRTSAWIMPGILLAGVLLLIGAVTAHNGTMIIVTFAVLAVAVTAARRSSEDGRKR